MTRNQKRAVSSCENLRVGSSLGGGAEMLLWDSSAQSGCFSASNTNTSELTLRGSIMMSVELTSPMIFKA